MSSDVLFRAPLALAITVRYRFFLCAGLLPYLLGAAWAAAVEHVFDGNAFLLGLVGVLCALVAVECFNEHFDSRLGTDRVFDPSDEDPIPSFVLPIGIGALLLAAAIGAFLVAQQQRAGLAMVAYAVVGGAAAVFYVGPPLRLVYRGLGELVIALCYGPALTLGSAQLHTGRLPAGALVLASLVPGLFIMALAVGNAVPDFLQDSLVGKRNLVVRLGRRRGVMLLGALGIAGASILAVGAAWALFPRVTLLPAGIAALLVLRAARAGLPVCERSAREFIPATRALVLAYLVAVFGLIVVLLLLLPVPPWG